MIVVDVETTGIDPIKNSIVSIGAVDFLNPQNTFYKECKTWRGAEISDQALKINGFTRKQINSNKKDKLRQTIIDFYVWSSQVYDATIAGHNPSFDIGFLNDSLKRSGLKYYFGKRSVDLHSLCYENYIKSGKLTPLLKNKSDLNLDKVLNYVGLPSEPKPHNALIGAKMEAEAFSRFFYGKHLFNEYKEYSVPNYLKK